MDYLNWNLWNEDKQSGIRIADGIITDTAFSDKAQEDLLSLEDDSWWFAYRADVIVEQMNKYFSKEKLTLDIGGGNGYTSSVAKQKGYFTGIIEPNPVACRHAKVRGVDEVNCGAVTDESVLAGSIDQALLLDVLEHIEDESAFIKLLYHKLNKGGNIIITVPAFACLWSSEDEAAGHFRRYRIGDLCDLLEINGFEICYRSYFMGFLFLPILFVRVLLEKIGLLKKQSERSEEERRRIAKAQFKTECGFVDLILSFFINFEKKLMRKEERVPFGSSIIVVARKKG